MPSITVEVNGLAGPVSQVTLQSDATVGELKRAIEAKASIPTKRQRLMYRNAPLNNHFNLGYLSKGRDIYSSGKEESAQDSGDSGVVEKTLQMVLIKRTDEQTSIITEIAEWGCDEFLDYLEALQEEQEHLLDDADVMTAAIQKNAKAMKYASQRLRSDRGFVLAQVALCAYWLEHANKSLLSDKQFVMSAVALNGYALKNVGVFRSDRDVVKVALSKTGRALEHASPELQADIDIVRFAVKKDGQALAYAASGFKSNKELALLAVRQDGRALRYVDESLRADEEVVSAALEQSPMAIIWVAGPLRSQPKMKELLEEEELRDQHGLAMFTRIIKNREWGSDSD